MSTVVRHDHEIMHVWNEPRPDKLGRPPGPRPDRDVRRATSDLDRHTIPLRAPVQLAPPAPAQGVIDCVPDQHMREQENVSTYLLWPHQEPGHQTLRNVIRPIEQIRQSRVYEPLAEDRRSLYRRFLRWIKPIDALLYQTLDRARDRNGLALGALRKALYGFFDDTLR
jgi:hypothetical protein